MNYSDNFKTLIATVKDGYIGHGNPNAKILIIGQEPAIDREHEEYPGQYNIEIATNSQQWNEIISKSIGYEAIDPSKVEFGLPLHPYPNQLFQRRTKSKKKAAFNGDSGTAPTWYKYQLLINFIFSENLSKNSPLTFHRKTFHTDMSDVSAKKHPKIEESSIESVMKRKNLLSHPFFRSFPIVIAAVGHFPRDSYGNEYFKDIFDVDFIGNKAADGMPWINVSVRLGDNPQLIIHTPQFASSFRNSYLERIAHIVNKFAREYNINLNPEM